MVAAASPSSSGCGVGLGLGRFIRSPQGGGQDRSPGTLAITVPVERRTDLGRGGARHRRSANPGPVTIAGTRGGGCRGRGRHRPPERAASWRGRGGAGGKGRPVPCSRYVHLPRLRTGDIGDDVAQLEARSRGSVTTRAPSTGPTTTHREAISAGTAAATPERPDRDEEPSSKQTRRVVAASRHAAAQRALDEPARSPRETVVRQTPPCAPRARRATASVSAEAAINTDQRTVRDRRGPPTAERTAAQRRAEGGPGEIAEPSRALRALGPRRGRRALRVIRTEQTPRAPGHDAVRCGGRRAASTAARAPRRAAEVAAAREQAGPRDGPRRCRRSSA